MHQSNKREFLSGLQYLLIGVIAESAVILWFSQRPPAQRLGIWAIIAIALGIIRQVILSLAEWTGKKDWQNISRRDW